MNDKQTPIGASATCLVCGSAPTIRSHLLPEAFVREVHTDRKSGEQHMLHHAEKAFKQASKTGRFERGILCGPCDGILGRHEEIAFKLLRQLRQRRVGDKTAGRWKIRDRTVPFNVPEDDAFVRFACGILWKFSSIERGYPAYLELGRFRPILEAICFGRSTIPISVDVFLERDLFQVVSFDNPVDVFYYRTPSMGPRGTLQVAQMAWFNVGGFTTYVRLDRRPSDLAPRRCWMAGRKQAHFVVSGRSFEANIDVVASMQEVKGDLERLNPKLTKPARRSR